MPSPVGHSLIGLAIALPYWLPRGSGWSGVKQTVRSHWRAMVACALLANAPDLDYLPGMATGDLNAYHHYFTHSIGWASLFGMAAWLIWKGFNPRIGLIALGLMMGLQFSHLLADWVTADGRPPIGIMMWWPVNSDFTISSETIFWPLHKATYAEMFQWHNVQAVLIEAAWCAIPVAVGLAKALLGQPASPPLR